MENKNKLNPLISGGILVNDNDYFEKDNENMGNDSLKASLALLKSIKNQKRGEMNALNNSYLKEELTVSDRNETNMFDIPVSEENNSETSKSFIVPDDTNNIDTDVINKLFKIEDNNSEDQSNISQSQTYGISLQDLDNNNQNDLLVKKDEYIPDYRSEEYQEQANNSSSEIQTPLYSVNQTDTIDPNQFLTEDITTQEEPKYVIDDGKKQKHTPVSTNEEIKSGKGIAWLAYIIFFIPLLFNRQNKYIRWHANEGFELFILDILGAGLFCVGWFVKSSNELYTILLLASLTAGAVIIAISVFTRIIMIPFALAGKEVQHPWLFHKHRIIK